MLLYIAGQPKHLWKSGRGAAHLTVIFDQQVDGALGAEVVRARVLANDPTYIQYQLRSASSLAAVLNHVHEHVLCSNKDGGAKRRGAACKKKKKKKKHEIP